MKFRDIKPFSTASWSCDVPIAYLKPHFARWLKEYNLNLDPDFQRGHVWSDIQRTKYVEYLLRGGISSKIIYFNCPGWMTDWSGEFVIVDGKQRLEACLRFLDNKLKVFGCYLNEYEDSIGLMNMEGLKIAVNNLKTKADVLQWYLDLNSGGVIHTNNELERVKKLLEIEQKKT